MTTMDLGIDLGTTNCVATTWWDGGPFTLPIQARLPRELLPSVVLFEPGQVYVGEAALARARRSPERLVRSIKTDMGTAIRRTFDGRDYLPEEISALIVGEVISRARDAFATMTGQPEVTVRALTVTVPARFNLKAVQATRQAIALCGFEGERVRILRESDAAALAYIRGDPNPQTVLVFDLGGGTFDLSVLRFTGKAPAFFEHLGPPGGDPRLGGDVFDQRIFERMAGHAAAHGVPWDLRDPEAPPRVDRPAWIGARAAVREHARQWKETACDASIPADFPVEVYLPEVLDHLVTAPFAMRRAELDALIAPELDAAFAELVRLLDELGLDRGDIDRVVLAGGSTRIPAIRRRLHDFFGFAPNDALASDKAIAIGACIHNRVLESLTEDERRAVIPPTYLTVPVGLRVTKQVSEALDLEDARDQFEPVLERGLRCPDTRTRTFTTVRNRQERLRFEVFVQEHGACQPDNFVAFFELTLPPAARGPRGAPKIEVTFGVDATGSLLTVTAVERRTGTEIADIARIDDRLQIRPERSGDVEIALDEFGNPRGLQYDLGGDLNAICEGKRILLYVACSDSNERFTWEDAVVAVGERGFEMDTQERETQGTIDNLDLSPYDQIWFVSDYRQTITPTLLQRLDAFVAAGKGLLIWTDNAPWFEDGNVLAQRYTGSSFSGNDPGDRVLQPADTLSGGYFIDHPLTEGLNNLYEGVTISRIDPGPEVTVLALGSDGYPCMAAYDNGTTRIVLDTGFTKLYEGKFTHTAGTARYFRNIAFWLLPESRAFT